MNSNTDSAGDGFGAAGGALHLPSAAEKEAEERLYLVVRSDLAFGLAGIVRAAVRVTWLGLDQARRVAPERAARYALSPAQPKIAVRAKGAASLAKMLAEAAAVGLPVARLEVAGEPLCGAIGPARRSELPPAVARAQILGDDGAVPAPCAAPVAGPTLTVVVIDAAAIPHGKLAAQAGHAVWSALGQGGGEDLIARARAWEDAGMPVAVRHARLDAARHALAVAQARSIPCGLIVDAGRTVFGAPTPTCAWFGPWADDLLLDLATA